MRTGLGCVGLLNGCKNLLKTILCLVVLTRSRRLTEMALDAGTCWLALLIRLAVQS